MNHRNFVSRDGPICPGGQVAVQATRSLFASSFDGGLRETCHESLQGCAKSIAENPKSD